MREALNLVREMFGKIKNKKIIVWIFIILILGTLILYPLIDANLLYYKRVIQRIIILDDITKEITNNKLSNKYFHLKCCILTKENQPK